MYIAQIYSIILLSFGAAALYLGISARRRQFKDFAGNAILGLLCFSSAVWCYGFGMVFLTSNITIAYWGRTLGMIGVFAYLILVQIMVGILGNIPKAAYRAFCIFALLGLVIYFPTVSPRVTLYYMEDTGMTYTFKRGLANNIYTVYSLIYAVNMVVSITFIIKNAQNRREKTTSHKMGITLIIVFMGMILDTILPMFGFGAIPGSSITQFFGLLVMYYAIVDLNKTRLTPINMSRYIYESVSEPVMVFDMDGVLMLSNNAALEVFGETFVHYNDKPMKLTDIFLLDENHLDYEGNHRTDDTSSVIGNVPVQLQTSRIKDRFGDVIGFIITVKDMTHINEIMDSLVEAKRLAEANSLAKSTFLANMSHEIRTPLNAIVGFSELLLKSDLPTEDKEQAEDIRNASHNLLAIINDILDISKIESGKMELNEINYNISDVIKDAFLITETLANAKGLSFSIDVDENIPSGLYGDPVRVRGVLVNILNNAVKYTKTGSVRFEGKTVKIENDTAVLEFKIIDTGIGIRESDRDKLFDSFMRVDKGKNSGIEGTGLGLAIVKGFVELMGGSVGVESIYGKGTTFTVTIPQRIVENVPIGKILVKSESKVLKSSIGSVKYSGVKVLAVDDNRVNLKVISKILKQYDMDVTAVDSGFAAIETCKENNYDIILMDQMMPVMNGVEAMNHIRELGGCYSSGNCAIIALTANAITGVKEQLLGEGFDAYLSKPINFTQIEETFSNIIGKG